MTSPIINYPKASNCKWINKISLYVKNRFFQLMRKQSLQVNYIPHLRQTHIRCALHKFMKNKNNNPHHNYTHHSAKINQLKSLSSMDLITQLSRGWKRAREGESPKTWMVHSNAPQICLLLSCCAHCLGNSATCSRTQKDRQLFQTKSTCF